MKLTSPGFANNQLIPAQYTCDGQDINPPLEISEAPEKTKNLVLIIDDPDAPAGSWVHWLIWNIPPETTKIEANKIPPGATEGTTSFGKTGYGGPCPPAGSHRYVFKLYALDTPLNLPDSTNKDQLEAAMTLHILEQTELIGIYSRQK